MGRREPRSRRSEPAVVRGVDCCIGLAVEAVDAGDGGFERYAKTTRRGAFLAEMERVVPWSVLGALIEPFYPKPGNGRPAVGVERMLRMISCSSGSMCRTRRSTRRFTALQGSFSAEYRDRTGRCATACGTIP